MRNNEVAWLVWHPLRWAKYLRTPIHKSRDSRKRIWIHFLSSWQIVTLIYWEPLGIGRLVLIRHAKNEIKMHIQDEHGAKSLEPHWGYSSRVIPCVNDNGTCEYLSVVYHSHDVSMLYTFIIWAVLGVTLVIWLAVRVLAPRFGILTMIYGEAGQAEQKAGILHRFSRATIASRRRWLLPEGIPSIFGHASRL